MVKSLERSAVALGIIYAEGGQQLEYLPLHLDGGRVQGCNRGV
jgi:hypothetical protein